MTLCHKKGGERLNKRQKSILAIIISMLLILANVNYIAIAEVEQDNEVGVIKKVEQPQIVQELVEQRGLSTKHFLMDDGTFQAVEYGKPVHYMDDGANERLITGCLK